MKLDEDCTFEKARKFYVYEKFNKFGIDEHHQFDCRVKNKEGSDTYNTNENSRNKVQQDNTNKGSSYFGMITDSSEDGDDRCVYASYYQEEDTTNNVVSNSESDYTDNAYANAPNLEANANAIFYNTSNSESDYTDNAYANAPNLEANANAIFL
jgi:hypothetical protein